MRNVLASPAATRVRLKPDTTAAVRLEPDTTPAARGTTTGRLRGERGAALLEAAVTIPLLLALATGIFEFGRAFQTWQVLTNAAREGARAAVVPNAVGTAVQTRVRTYMSDATLSAAATATVNVDRNATMTVNGVAVSASRVTVDYPFQFMVLQPVMRLLHSVTNTGAPLTMHAEVLMRNEAQ